MVTSTEHVIIKDSSTRDKPPSNTRFVIAILLPALFIFFTAILFPIIVGIFISFTNSSGSTGFFGDQVTLVNFYELLVFGNLNSRQFWQYTYQTLFFSVISLVLEFLLGLIFALLLNKNFKGRGLARATLLIPWAVPTVASATLFRFEIFNTADEFGLINSLIVLMGGLPIDFFGVDAPILFEIPYFFPFDPFMDTLPITMTMFTVIIVDVWKTTPFITLLLLASLQIVPQDLYKAAEVAGASSWQKFRYVTWPLIKPGAGVALIFRMMQALRVYDAVAVFNDTDVFSMTTQAVNFWLTGDYGLASAVTVMLLLFIVIFAVVIFALTGREKRETGNEKKGFFKKMFKRGDSGDKMEDISELRDDQEEKILLKSESIKLEEQRIKLEPISPAKIKRYQAQRYAKKGVFIFLVLFMCLFCAGPFIWIVLRSFRDPFRFPDIIQTEFELLPKFFSFRAYEVIFANSGIYGVTFDRALLNGLILSGLTVLVVLIAGSLIAYALAKFEFRFKGVLNGFIFSMNSLPPLIIIIPFYIQIITVATLFPVLDLTNNLLGLVLPYAAFNLPLAVFVLRAFFKEIPEDLWNAAKVDGASNFQIFWKVIMPLTIPGVFTVAILVFIAAWNELLFAQIFLITPENHTVPRAILRYVRNPQSLTANWDTDIALMAATSIATVPLVIIVLIFQKKIISGLTQGAVKG